MMSAANVAHTVSPWSSHQTLRSISRAYRPATLRGHTTRGGGMPVLTESRSDTQVLTGVFRATFVPRDYTLDSFIVQCENFAALLQFVRIEPQEFPTHLGDLLTSPWKLKGTMRDTVDILS